MAHIHKDRVAETATTTGTGAFTLAGTTTGYRTFASVCSVGDTVYYTIAHRSAAEWETGIGTYSAANTLTRTSVLQSSNSNAAVNFSAGTKDVFIAGVSDGVLTYADALVQFRSASDVLGGDEGIAAAFISRTAAVNDYADVLTGVGRVTDFFALTRATTATYVNRSGLIATAAAGEIRYTHDPITLERLGALFEGQATNLSLRAAEFDNASWTKTRTTTSANSTASPGGTAVADTLIEDSTASNSHFANQNVTITANSVYTASVWAKQASGTRLLQLSWDDASANGQYATFNLTTGVVTAGPTTFGTVSGSNATITAFPGGWYRCTITGTCGASATTGRFLLALSSGATTLTPSYSGDGASGVYLWGAQIELGTVATSYIATTSATVTRNADSLVAAAGSFPVNSTGDCTLYWRGRIRGLQSSAGVGLLLRAYDGTSNEGILLREGQVISGTDVVVVDGAVTQTDSASKSVTLGDVQRLAVSVRANALKFYGNRLSVDTDAALTLPIITQLTISPAAGSVYEVDAVAYITRAMSTTELAAMTSR